MSLLIQLIIGELELVKVDDHVHPVRAKRRRVGMSVGARGRTLLFEAAHPGRVLVLVAILVHGNHVHQERVRCVGVEIKQLHFEGWKHPPVHVMWW